MPHASPHAPPRAHALDCGCCRAALAGLTIADPVCDGDDFAPPTRPRTVGPFDIVEAWGHAPIVDVNRSKRECPR